MFPLGSKMIKCVWSHEFIHHLPMVPRKQTVKRMRICPKNAPWHAAFTAVVSHERSVKMCWANGSVLNEPIPRPQPFPRGWTNPRAQHGHKFDSVVCQKSYQNRINYVLHHTCGGIKYRLSRATAGHNTDIDFLCFFSDTFRIFCGKRWKDSKLYLRAGTSRSPVNGLLCKQVVNVDASRVGWRFEPAEVN